MKELREKIAVLAAPIIEQQGAFLVEVALHQEHRDRVVQVLVDTDAGITIEACAEVSRAISAAIENDNAIEGPYRLEVSSPGIDKPLRMLRQFPKNVGRPFTVRYRSGDGDRTVAGTLAAVKGERLTFSPEKLEPVTVAFADIIECKEKLPW